MSRFPFIVTTRPVCAGCGKQCGARHHDWLTQQHRPSPWDGIRWRFKYNPFCTLRCALDYARRAVKEAQP